MNAPTFVKLVDVFDDPLFVNLAMVKRFEVRDHWEEGCEEPLRVIFIVWIGNDADTHTRSGPGDLADQLARLGVQA